MQHGEFEPFADIPIVIVVNVVAVIGDSAGGFPHLLIAASATWWMLHSARTLPHVRMASNINNIAFHVTLTWLAWCAALAQFTSSSVHSYSNMPMLALLGAPVAWASGHMWGSASVTSLLGQHVRNIQEPHAVAAWSYARLQSGVEALELLRVKRVNAAGHKHDASTTAAGFEKDKSSHRGAAGNTLAAISAVAAGAHGAPDGGAALQRPVATAVNTALAGSKKRRRSILTSMNRSTHVLHNSPARRSVVGLSTRVENLAANMRSLLGRAQSLLTGAQLSSAVATPEGLMLQAALHAQQVDVAVQQLQAFAGTSPDISLHCALMLSSKLMRSGVTAAMRQLGACASSLPSGTHCIAVSERFLSLVRSHFDMFTLKSSGGTLHRSVATGLGVSGATGLQMSICSTLPARSALESVVGHEFYYFSAAIQLHARQARLAQLRFLKAQYDAWKSSMRHVVDLSAVHRTALEMEAARVRAEVHLGALSRLRPDDASIKRRLKEFRDGVASHDSAVAGQDSHQVLDDAFATASQRPSRKPAPVLMKVQDFVPACTAMPSGGRSGSWAAMQLGAHVQDHLDRHARGLSGVRVAALSRLLGLVPAAAADSPLLQAVHELSAADDIHTNDILLQSSIAHGPSAGQPLYAAFVVSGEAGSVGRILRADDAACELLGRTRGDLEGTHVSTVLPAPYSALSQAQLEGWLDDVDVWLGRWFMGAVVGGGGHLVPVRGALFEAPTHLHSIAAGSQTAQSRSSSASAFSCVFSLILQPVQLADCVGIALVRASPVVQNTNESAAAAVRRQSMIGHSASASSAAVVPRVGTVEVLHASSAVHRLLGTEAVVGASAGADGLPVLSNWIPMLGVCGGDVMLPGHSSTPIPNAAVAEHVGKERISPADREQAASTNPFPVLKKRQTPSRSNHKRASLDGLGYSEEVDSSVARQAAAALAAHTMVGLAAHTHVRLHDAKFVTAGGTNDVCTLSLHACVPISDGHLGVGEPGVHSAVEIGSEHDSDEHDAARATPGGGGEQDVQDDLQHASDVHFFVFVEACSHRSEDTAAMQAEQLHTGDGAAIETAPNTMAAATDAESSGEDSVSDKGNKRGETVPMHALLDFMRPLHLRPAALVNSSLRGVLTAVLLLTILAYPAGILSVATMASVDFSVALEARRLRVLQQAQFTLGAQARAAAGYGDFFNATAGMQDLTGLRLQMSELFDEVQEQTDFRSAAFQVLTGYKMPAKLSAATVQVLDTSVAEPRSLTPVASMELMRSLLQEVTAEALQEGLPPRDITAQENLFSTAQMLWLNLRPTIPGGLQQNSQQLLQTLLEDEAAIITAVVVVAVLVTLSVVIARVCCVAPRVYRLVKQLNGVATTVGTALTRVPWSLAGQMRAKAMADLQAAADDDWVAQFSSTSDEDLQVSQLRAHIQMLAVDDSRTGVGESQNDAPVAGASHPLRRFHDSQRSVSQAVEAHRERAGSTADSDFGSGHEWEPVKKLKESASLKKPQCCACLPSFVLVLLFLVVVVLVRDTVSISAQAASNQLAVHFMASTQAEYFSAVTDLVHISDFEALAESDEAQFSAAGGGFNLSTVLLPRTAAFDRVESAHADFLGAIDRVLFGGNLPLDIPSKDSPVGFGPGAPQARVLETGFQGFFQDNACARIDADSASGFAIAPLNVPLARSTPALLPTVFSLYFPNCSSSSTGAALAGFSGTAQLYVVLGQTVVQSFAALPSNVSTASLSQHATAGPALREFAALDSTVMKPTVDFLLQRADKEFDALDGNFGQLCLFIASLLPILALVLCCVALPSTDAFAARSLHSLTLLLLLDQASKEGAARGMSLASQRSHSASLAASPSLPSRRKEHELVARLRRFHDKAAGGSERSSKLQFDITGRAEDDAARCCCCSSAFCAQTCGAACSACSPVEPDLSRDRSGYDSGDSFSDDGN